MVSMALVVALLIPVLLTGLPIAFSILLVCTAFILLTGMDPTIPGTTIFWFLNKSEIVAIPFFILAADILGKSKATDALIAATNVLFGRMRGGLALVAMISVMVFSAICGSSVATAVAVGRVMIPKLVENGYDQRFSLGLIAASGGLGILIPPSVPLIVYSTIAEISVGDVFLAALGPGVLLGLMFCAFVIILGDRVRDPSKIRAIPVEADRARLVWRGLPVFGLPLVILGGIYGGVFTPTEAAAVAVILAALLAFTIYRDPEMESLGSMLAGAGNVSASILIIMAGTSVLSYLLTDNQVPLRFGEFIIGLDLSPLVFLLCVNALLLVLGCFLEIISIILITVPIFLPVLHKLDIDLIHFAIIVTINMELAVITPPIGMNLFVISAISKRPIVEVFLGTLPFAALLLVALLIFTMSEPLTLFLLRFMKAGL